MLQDYLLVMEHDVDNNTFLYSADLGFGSPLQVISYDSIADIGTVVSMRIIDPEVLQPNYPSK